MRPEPENRPVHSCLPAAGQAYGRPPDRSDRPMKAHVTSHFTAAIARRGRATMDEHRRAHRVERSPEDRKGERRLGRLEFLLLALIALGVGITIAMAVFDPGA
jgi:hypothetical protein